MSKHKRSDAELYAAMAKPFATAEACNQAVEGFFEELGDLRRKYKITDLYTIIGASYLGPRHDAHERPLLPAEDDEQSTATRIMGSMIFGDPLHAEAMTAFAFGKEQAERQGTIESLLTETLRKARKAIRNRA